MQIIFRSTSNNFSGIQKYLSPLGNKVLETSNAIVVYCLYLQWEERPTFFPTMCSHQEPLLEGRDLTLQRKKLEPPEGLGVEQS